ncbi:MAG: GNAT family N-acetyltransferase, partial [Bacilli bacterium]|nr:GNAT family N-acetyltransferase [Bacilli bacterium]
HPCAPAIRINSNEYFFLLHRGYSIIGQEDAFHLDLSDYEISEDIQKILDEAKKEGITIELYDKNKHYGLEEFYKELNIYDFEKVIRSNLELEHPYPFLVVAKDNKVVGWTGAMWNEESGRGHFDGIAILSSVRGRGLGKALFSLLAYYNKKGGAKFMTFYTGLTNHARYIYMGAGFKIIESFALMKKELK